MSNSKKIGILAVVVMIVIMVYVGAGLSKTAKDISAKTQAVNTEYIQYLGY